MKLFLDRPEVDDKIRHPALLAACQSGKTKVVAALLERDDMDVNFKDKYGDTPLIAAAEDGNIENVALLLANPATQVNAQGARQQTALAKAAQYDNLDVIRMLLEHGADTSILDKNGNSCLELALQDEQYQVAVVLVASGMTVRNIHFKDKLILEWVAPFLTHDVALRLLQLDFPVEKSESGVVSARDNHSFSWTTFLDSHVPVDPAVRVSVVSTMLRAGDDEWIRELATAKDQHGREALQTTDAATRDFLNGLRFFCGRYEIFDGPAIHVSSTAVVVHAYDHGVFQQVFDMHANADGELDKAGFIACGRVLGQQPSAADIKKQVGSAHEFDLWDKDQSGHLSATEYLRYCDQTFGGKLKVAMKFMRNADEHAREVETRNGLDIQFVLGLLPALPQPMFDANVGTLHLHGGVAMKQYPNVLVMPAADRSLEDIFLKERPNDNQIRSMLHEVAAALQHLHDHGVVHGDLKKLNILRVNHHMRVIDMDAATPIGNPIGAKFSSGSLPPEMFYRLQGDRDAAAIAAHWNDQVDANPELWAKVQPRHHYCVKTFHDVSASTTLPFKPVLASPAIDVWAFGVVMYQMYSGVELVPTDINQDVDESGIVRAATWTDADVAKRLNNKVSNALARDLIAKLLVVDPDDRISVAGILAHPYFEVKYDDASGQLLLDKLDALHVQVASGFQTVATRLDEVVFVTRETLKAVGDAKTDLMRGIFEATEVAFPTSFVVLPMDLTTPPLVDDDAEDVLRDVTSFVQKGIDMGHNFMHAVKQNKAIGRALRLVGPGEPLFLYLLDEVLGLPVVPPPGSVYPIRIETKSDEYTQFMSAAMPYLQTGFRLLQGVSTIAGLLSCLGLPSLDPRVIDDLGDQIDNAKKTSSVFDFDVLQRAVEDEGVPVQHIRGAALRELERFFKKYDHDKDYAGLCRTYASNGQALWTTPLTVATMEQSRPTSTAGLQQAKPIANTTGGKTAQQIYIDLLAQNEMMPEPPSLATVVVGGVPSMLPGGKARPDVDRPTCCGMM
ncbi:serine/threonine protein kinase, variant 1 [Aphanomyces invadans]|nr:serine/threonine protein kinase, variant 1 [Aphanomyces invadans]ETW06427.1 serine/threonine protein kinase, variant 1 [Aphanomyces invadans]|eukprot:XP_008864502.1 serine/threonine protein kinase, variant 1 [Aphanomyces invadans]